MDTSLSCESSVWQEKIAHYDNKIKAVWQCLRDLRFVILAVENLGVKLKFGFLACQGLCLARKAIRKRFCALLVMANKSTLWI